MDFKEAWLAIVAITIILVVSALFVFYTKKEERSLGVPAAVIKCDLWRGFDGRECRVYEK